MVEVYVGVSTNRRTIVVCEIGHLYYIKVIINSELFVLTGCVWCYLNVIKSGISLFYCVHVCCDVLNKGYV